MIDVENLLTIEEKLWSSLETIRYLENHNKENLEKVDTCNITDEKYNS